jgi:hypothetical protein
VFGAQALQDTGGAAGKNLFTLTGNGTYTVHATGPHPTPLSKIRLVQVNRSFFDPDLPEQVLSKVDSLDLGLTGLSTIYDGKCVLLNMDTVKGLLGRK